MWIRYEAETQRREEKLSLSNPAKKDAPRRIQQINLKFNRTGDKAAVRLK